MANEDDFDAALEERLTLASDPSYEGEPMRKKEVISLLLASFALPMAVMLIGWWLR